MSNSTYIELEDDDREEVCMSSTSERKRRREKDVKPEPQEECNQGDRSMIAHFERITRPVPLIARIKQIKNYDRARI